MKLFLLPLLLLLVPSLAQRPSPPNAAPNNNPPCKLDKDCPAAGFTCSAPDAALCVSDRCKCRIPHLGEQECTPRNAYPLARPINTTRLVEDAKEFCQQSHASLAAGKMLPGSVIRSRGFGRDGEKHFLLHWMSWCRLTAGGGQSVLDPLGLGEVWDRGLSRCTSLLTENWTRCSHSGGVGGVRNAGCVRYETAPGLA